MNLIIDLIIVLAAAAAIYLGLSRGFVRSVMHFASLILAVIAVFLFTNPVSAWLNSTFIKSGVSDIIEESLSDLIFDGENSFSVPDIFSEPPQALKDILGRFDVEFDDIAGFYSSNVSPSTNEGDAIDVIAEQIAYPTSNAISHILAAIIVFIAAMVLIKLITFVLDRICRLPVLRKLNKLLGLLFGIASALVISLVIANAAVGLIEAFDSINSTVFNTETIERSIILKFFDNNGLILLKFN